MARGNIFANLENKYQFATESQIIDMAFNALVRAISANGLEDTIRTGIILIGARVGFDENGFLNEKEKKLVRNVIGKVYSADLEEDIFPVVAQRVTENDYTVLEMLNKLGPAVALPTLEYILACAYIDGYINDSTASRLESIFGIALMAGFFASGLESVPAPIRQVKLTSLEKRIINAFKRDDSLATIDDVCGRFSGVSRMSIIDALDTLCEKEILYKTETAVGDMYGLIDDDIEVSGDDYEDDDDDDRFAGNQKKEAEPEFKDLRDRLLNLLLDAASTHPYTTGYDHPDDKSMTIAEIQDKDSLLASVSNLRVAAILRCMMNEGIVDKQVHKRKNFYFITEKYYRLEKEKQEAEEKKKLEEQEAEKKKKLEERIKKFPKEFKSHKEKILDILSKSDCPLSSTGIYHSINGLNGKSKQMVNDILAKLVSERKIKTLEKTSTTYYYVANGRYTRNLSELGALKKTALKLEGEISKSDDLYRKNRFNPFRQKAARSALEEKQKYESELRKTRAKIEDLEKKTMVQ